MDFKKFNKLMESSEVCPECGEELFFDDDEGVWRCDACDWESERDEDYDMSSGPCPNCGKQMLKPTDDGFHCNNCGEFFKNEEDDDQ